MRTKTKRILFGVASLWKNKVDDRGKARVCHFGPCREYRENEWNEAARAEQNPSVCNLVSPYRMCPVSYIIYSFLAVKFGRS